MPITHTPGPWTIQADQSDRGRSTVICAAGDDDLVIARIPSRAWDTNAWLEYPQDRANAQLIAAAPDMLAALENLENDNGSIPDHAWALVQAAIAKATDR